MFSAGGDFDLIEKNMKDYNALLRTWKEARDIVYNVINCSKPIVSTMRGPAVGAGLVAAFWPTSRSPRRRPRSSTATQGSASPPAITR